jgi:hypothetical protein
VGLPSQHDEDGLGRVFRVRRAAKDALANLQNHLAMAIHQNGKCAVVARGHESLKQVRVGVRTRSDTLGHLLDESQQCVARCHADELAASRGLRHF